MSSLRSEFLRAGLYSHGFRVNLTNFFPLKVAAFCGSCYGSMSFATSHTRKCDCHGHQAACGMYRPAVDTYGSGVVRIEDPNGLWRILAWVGIGLPPGTLFDPEIASTSCPQQAVAGQVWAVDSLCTVLPFLSRDTDAQTLEGRPG